MKTQLIQVAPAGASQASGVHRTVDGEKRPLRQLLRCAQLSSTMALNPQPLDKTSTPEHQSPHRGRIACRALRRTVREGQDLVVGLAVVSNPRFRPM